VALIAAFFGFGGVAGLRLKARACSSGSQSFCLSSLPCLALCAERKRSRLFKLQKEKVMNWDTIQGNWKQMTGNVKEQWGKLTDDDLSKINGKREQLEGRILELYGKSKDEAKREVDAFLNRTKQ
jgi:uncharacterized protein YjbJ (UPF0337 family)